MSTATDTAHRILREQREEIDRAMEHATQGWECINTVLAKALGKEQSGLDDDDYTRAYNEIGALRHIEVLDNLLGEAMKVAEELDKAMITMFGDNRCGQCTYFLGRLDSALCASSLVPITQDTYACEKFAKTKEGVA